MATSEIKVPSTAKGDKSDTSRRSNLSDRPPTKYPNDKPDVQDGLGLSSAVGGSVPDNVISVKCLIPGFPSTSKRFLDGSLSYTCMDDTGGTWTFLGAKDEVLVTWKPRS